MQGALRSEMMTGIIKNKIDKIWSDIWISGITNSLSTYPMFIRFLDEKEI